MKFSKSIYIINIICNNKILNTTICNNAIYKQLYSINYNDKRITNYFLHFYGRKKIKF